MKKSRQFSDVKILGLAPVFLIISACQSAESKVVTLEQGVIARVNGCHVSVDGVNYNPKYPNPFVYFRHACDVPESALKEKNWWGNQPEPLMNTLKLGACVRLDDTYYCAKKMEPGKSVTLEATYKAAIRDGSIIERVE